MREIAGSTPGLDSYDDTHVVFLYCGILSCNDLKESTYMT
jgi:hypothetical protein